MDKEKQIKEMAMVAAQMMVDEIRIQVAKHTNGHLPLFPNTEEEFTKYIEQFIEVFKKFEF
jgi:demethoxyubiquinone hydroxylase (CLK1/Coq7/Cat5 family)